MWTAVVLAAVTTASRCSVSSTPQVQPENFSIESKERLARREEGPGSNRRQMVRNRRKTPIAWEGSALKTTGLVLARAPTSSYA